jgi:hypothetical protein
MRTYFEAFRADNSQVLGNLDGQGVTHAFSYRRTKHYRALLLGSARPRWPDIAYWKVVTEDGKVLETIPNLFSKEASRCPSQPA